MNEVLDQALGTPTREQIDRLQGEMVKMPQADGMVTDHFFVPGMYCRKLFRKQGTLIVGKVHKAPHFFVCVSGEILAWSEKGMRHLHAGDVIESQPGTKRVTLALTDAIGMTVHQTQNTDLDAIEEELLEPDDTAVFDSGNRVKFDVPAFRALTSEVIADEKPGFFSDWTAEEQELYQAGKWREFSQSRGYSPDAIAKYARWRESIAEAFGKGMNPFALIADLTGDAALKNMALDAKGEIMLSSHVPFTDRSLP